jgi:SAM-dependent methyltransferase
MSSSTTATPSPQQTYPLSRSTIAATRLDLQHFLWTISAGHHLHPSIPVPPNALIADIGCGTGIWSLTFPLPSNHNNGIRFSAMDISLSQLPPPTWLPSHISSRQLDVFEENLPEDLLGKFDIVHVRFFLLVVRENDPRPILRNLLKLLKPGGYLHWQEYDTSRTEVVAAPGGKDGEEGGNGGKIAPAMNALHQLTTGGGRGNQNESEGGKTDKVFQNLSWVSTFPQFFGEKHGGDGIDAELIEQVTTTVPNHLLPLAQEIGFLGAREYASALKGGQPALAEKFEGVIGAAEEECWNGLARGAAIRSEMVTWIVRKREL